MSGDHAPDVEMKLIRQCELLVGRRASDDQTVMRRRRTANLEGPDRAQERDELPSGSRGRGLIAVLPRWSTGSPATFGRGVPQQRT